MSRARVALIGCGRVARVHATALTKLDSTELVAVVDNKPERAADFSKEYGGKAYSDYRDLLDDGDIDAFQICTPHHLHAEMTVAALKARKHVLTEKPMAITVRDADEMIATAESTGKALGVIFQNRYNDASQAIREHLDSGRLGAIKGVRAIVTWRRTDDYYRESDWKGTWDKEGGGVLIDQAIHTIDLMQWFTGEIQSITASYDNIAHSYIKVDDVAHAYIRFRNGAEGCLYANCFYSHDAPIYLELACEKGIASILGDTATIRIGNSSLKVEQSSDTDVSGKSYWGYSHLRQIDDFYDGVLNGRKPFIDGEAGKTAMDMVLAMYESSRSGQTIQFPYVPAL